MTSIPRESVPSLPRHEVSERPLLEGTSGRGGAGFEDFLFSLTDPAAQAFFRARPKPEPASSTRSDESRDRELRVSGQAEKPARAHDDNTEAQDPEAAAEKRARVRESRSVDRSLGSDDASIDSSLMAAAWPLMPVDSTAPPEIAEEDLDGLSDESSVDAMPAVMMPGSIMPVEERAASSEATTEFAASAQPLGDTEQDQPVTKSIDPAMNGQKLEAPRLQPISPDPQVATNLRRAVERPVIEPVESGIVPVDLEAEVVAAPVLAATPVRLPGSVETAWSHGSIVPESGATEPALPSDESHSSSGTISLGESNPNLLQVELSELPIAETLLEPSTAVQASVVEMSAPASRDVQTVSATPSPVNSMVAPNAPTQPINSPPTSAPSPSLATPPSRWLQGGEYRRFLHRMDRAFELAGQRGGEIRLRLSPPRLGSIRLEMRLDEERLVARIETDSEETRQIILEQFPVLRERLAERGVAVESFQVETRREGDSTSADQRDDSRQRRLRRADEPDVADVSGGGTGPIICRLPMSGNHLTGLDVIV